MLMGWIRTLTIGQMQGKFQMIVVKHTGHAIQVKNCDCLMILVLSLFVQWWSTWMQEDVPDEFADLVLNFISRNRIGSHGVEVCVCVVYQYHSLFATLVLEVRFCIIQFLQIPGMWKPSQQPKTWRSLHHRTMPKPSCDFHLFCLSAYKLQLAKTLARFRNGQYKKTRV